MWDCKACGTQGIAGDLSGCPGCGAARSAGPDGVTQVPADAGLVAALAPVIPAGAGIEAAPPAPPAPAAAAPEPLAIPDTTADEDTPPDTLADTSEAAASSIPDVVVPDGT